MKAAMDMRSKAVALVIGRRLEGPREEPPVLADLKASCVHCHTTFRVGIKLDPEKVPGETDAE